MKYTSLDFGTDRQYQISPKFVH